MNRILKSALWTLFSLVALGSCQSGELDLQTPESPVPQKELKEVIITASIADASGQTRTSYNEAEGKNYWSSGDKIKVFSAGEAAEFTSMNTEPETIVKFKGNIASITGSSNDDEDSKDYVWGLYPYSPSASYSEPDGISRTARMTLTYTDMQTGVAGTFGDNLAVMIGRSESLAIPFRGAYSGAFFKVNRDDIVSMTLEGLNGEVLAGTATIGLNDNLLPVIYDVADPKTAVTVTAPDGTFEPGANYYIITLPDVALPNGYKVTLRRADGYQGTYELRANRPLNRIKFRNLSDPIDVRIESAANIEAGTSTGWVQSTTQGINEIWYVTSDSSVAEYGTTHTGVAVNEVDTDNCVAPSDNGGVGILRFKGPVTKIDNYAFENNRKLTSIFWPETVETIGHGAFAQCTALSEIEIGPNVRVIEEDAFWDTAISTLSLPEGIRRIDNCAFQNIPITEVTIPNSVDSLGYSMPLSGTRPVIGNPFMDCAFLTTFHGRYASSDGKCLIDNGTVRSFATGGMTGASYEVPSDVTVIGIFSFVGATISHITLPSRLRAILDYSFMSCKITELTIPASVSMINQYAFIDCTRLNWIKIMRSSTVLEASTTWGLPGRMFHDTNDCPIYVPANLIDYYKGSQYWEVYENRYVPIIAPNAMLVTLTEGANINDIAWENVFTDPQIQDLGDDVYTVTGSNDVTTIPRNAFQNVATIKEATIPESVETIDTYAFAGCSNLEGVTFGSNVTQIMAEAFGVCKLEAVTLPESLTFLGASAFRNNPLTTVEIPAGLSTISQNPFLDCNNLTSFTGDNSMVSSDGLALINADGELLSYALAATTGEYQVPEGVVTIGKTAMKGAKFTKVILPSTLEKIGLGAFRYSDLTEITIPESVTEIIDFAFLGCSSLTKMRIEAEVAPTLGVSVFTYTPDDLEIWVPGLSATYYNNETSAQPNWYAMRNHIAYYQTDKEIWYHLEGDGTDQISLTSGTGANYTGSCIISPNNELSDIDPFVDVPETISAGKIMVLAYDNNLTMVPASAFTGYFETLDYVSLPNSVASVGSRAFEKCSKLVRMPFSENSAVWSINSYAFSQCTGLTGPVYLPKVSNLGSYVFNRCSNITEVTLGAATSIPIMGFASSGITRLNIAEPQNVTTVNRFAFYGASELTTIGTASAPEGRVMLINATNVGERAFGSAKVKRVYLGSVVNLGPYAFEGTSQLEFIDLNSLTRLQEYTFARSGIKALYLPAIETLDDMALGQAWNLTTLDLGSSLNSVGDFIFHDLHTTFVNTFEPDNLDIKFNGPLPATISSDAFFFNKDENSPLNGTLFDFKSVSVPSAALASYKQYFSSVGYTSTTIQNEVTGF